MRTKQAKKINTDLTDPTQQFKQLAEQHYVHTPFALQLQLIWNHLTWLTEMTMHPSRENARMLQLHRKKWTLAEMEQQRRDREKK